MDDILQDFSPAIVPLALDASLVAFGPFLGTLPHAVLHNEPGLCWVETGVPADNFNGVLQTRLEPKALPAAIERVFAYFQQRNLPFHWHIGPSSHPTGFGKLLEERGIVHAADEPGMALDLLVLNEDIPTVPNLAIHPVTNTELLQQWTRAWGCGAPEEIIQHWFTVYSGLLFRPQSSLRMYLGTIDEKPVATVALFYAAGVAAIHHVVAIHEARRQGIGAAMTLMAAREARSAGYRMAVLTASPMGINIYRRLGFREYCTVSTYAWGP